MVQLAKDPGDLSQPRALPCIIDVRICVAAGGRVDVAPKELAKKINRSLQVLPQAGIQNIVYQTVLIAGVGARKVLALQF